MLTLSRGGNRLRIGVRMGQLSSLGKFFNRIQGWVVAIVLEYRGHIHVVQRSQVIEVEDVVGDMCRAQYQVADYPAVVGYLVGDAEGAVQIEGGGLEWLVGQTPQMRWVYIWASRGSLPLRIISMPRKIMPEL